MKLRNDSVEILSKLCKGITDLVDHILIDNDLW